MGRHTISLSESVEELVHQNAEEGESFSAAVARLIREGAAARSGKKPPRYIASGQGPRDLGRAAESYLRKLVSAR